MIIPDTAEYYHNHCLPFGYVTEFAKNLALPIFHENWNRVSDVIPTF